VSTPFKALIIVSIGIGLFWLGVARLFTDNRLVLVPLFVVVALLVGLTLACLQGGAGAEAEG